MNQINFKSRSQFKIEIYFKIVNTVVLNYAISKKNK
jgi:hypothetical protein